jgi:hypothetical protein
MVATGTTVGAAGTQFPGIRFWNKAAPSISLVNANDFNRNELLRSLGLWCINVDVLGSLGTRDREEVLCRQRTVRFLSENPAIRKFLADDVGVIRHSDRLPSDGQYFLNALWKDPNTGHNHFFEEVHKLIALLGQGTLPKELDEFRRFLVGTVEGAEAAETALGKEMGAELERTTFFQGTILIGFDGSYTGRDRGRSDAWEVVDSAISGFQKYSYHLSGLCGSTKKPSWLDSRLAHLVGLSRLADYFIRRSDHRREKKRYADLLITEMPGMLKNILLNFARETFVDGLRDFDEADSAYFRLYVRYEDNKLVIRLVDFYSDKRSERHGGFYEANRRETSLRSIAPTLEMDFRGYSPRQVLELAKENQQLSDAVAKSQRQIEFSLPFLSFVRAKHPGLLKDGEKIKDPEIQDRFGWSSVEGLRQTSQFASKCQDVESYRTFVFSKVMELREILAALECLLNKSKEWGLPLSFPRILSDSEHVMSFDKLSPIHLIGRKVGGKNIQASDLVPISSLPPLNGRMIGLTGQNAGGKTVTAEALLGAIYLAQSGLPVFGENVALNVKSTLGMVFLERGEGSTLQLMLQKTKNVLEAVQRSPGKDIVVFLDEVGTGTQELAGLQLGERVLSSLAKAGCSVVFSTQITELAERAESKMGAVCYKMDLAHRIQPGIGAGGAEVLMENMGFSNLLDGSN